jgi:hypothetical protein
MDLRDLRLGGLQLGMGQGNGAPMVWEAMNNISDSWHQHASATDRVSHQVTTMQKSTESTRNAYNQAVAERDALRQQLQSAENRLAEVQRVVQRYAVVQEPVVASDGFTYERNVIQQYLDDCQRETQPAISQQTKEELGPNLVPNQSLKKLVELLKTVKAPESSSANSPQRERVEARESGTPSKDRRGGGGGDDRLHPCIRVYGYCNYKESCVYANYPFEACLNYLKGKCRFGATCKELHVEQQHHRSKK